MRATRKSDRRRLRSTPPTSSTDNHPPGNDSERESPIRRSQRIRKVQERATDLVSKYPTTPVPSKPRKRQLEESETCTEVIPPRNVLDQPTALNLLGILNLLNSRPPPALGQSRTSHVAHWAKQGQIWPSE
ncbi:MAG: hypothetical protein Q9176_004935 [Flavoplaca citrina]